MNPYAVPLKALMALPHGVRGKIQAFTYEELDRSINERASLVAQIAACAQNGQIALVESGRDCDGVQYSGYVTYIEATYQAYMAEYAHKAEWADGPFSFRIMRPSEAAEVRYSSRDLVAEAFEDGHPWVIYP